MSIDPRIFTESTGLSPKSETDHDSIATFLQTWVSEVEIGMMRTLSSAGLDGSHSEAYDDEAWDDEIRARMDAGLELAGDDIGTPIIAFDNAAGVRVGIFGPVITRVPDRDLSLQLWDGLTAVMAVPGFWELKRTRTERPEFGERP